MHAQLCISVRVLCTARLGVSTLDEAACCVALACVFAVPMRIVMVPRGEQNKVTSMDAPPRETVPLLVRVPTLSLYAAHTSRN